MTIMPDSDKVVAAIREAAAEDIMPRFQRLERHEISEKSPGEVVTIADIEAEHRLTRLLSDIVAGSAVVGEEAASRDPNILSRLQDRGPVWLIDPVDGTANFAEGRRVFAIIVCYLVDGIARAGWIHDPCTGKTAIAMTGEGAWYDGERMKPAAATPLERMIGTLNVGYFPSDRRKAVREAASRFKKIHSYRCAAHDYLALAGGSKHFSLYRRLWPWDHAAGVLLLAEAGGYTARLDGQPYRATGREEGILSVNAPESWERIKNLLNST
jgi:fructose-1,6-bisphosphatase/inositol monophosphatase family enzyme